MSNQEKSYRERELIININKNQKDFYEKPEKRKFNTAMKLFRIPKKKMYKLIHNVGIENKMIELQSEWMGDISHKKVLDFGCYDGNYLSYKLAKNAGKYIAIDLSNNAIERLRRNLEKRGIKNFKAIAVDILSDEFNEKNFDLIYAQGVIHHFKYLDVILNRMYELLNQNGFVITRDPLQSSFTSRAVRYFYHRIRTDREWEWPLSRKDFHTIRRYFNIKYIQGFMGVSILGVPITFINNKLAVKITERLHEIDLNKASSVNDSLYKCMQAIMCLEKISIEALGKERDNLQII